MSSSLIGVTPGPGACDTGAVSVYRATAVCWAAVGDHRGAADGVDDLLDRQAEAECLIDEGVDDPLHEIGAPTGTEPIGSSRRDEHADPAPLVEHAFVGQLLARPSLPSPG